MGQLHQKKQIKHQQHDPKILLKCSSCDRIVSCDSITVRVICEICCMKYITIDKEKLVEKKVNIGFPSGWRFYKTFVHQDGRVFERGVENVSLKGTLKPTEILKRVKKSKFEREKDRMEKEKKMAEKYRKKIEKKKKLELKNKINDTRR